VLAESERPAIHGEYQMTTGEFLRVVHSLTRGLAMYCYGFVCLSFAAVDIACGDGLLAVVLLPLAFVFFTGLLGVPFQWWAMRGRTEIFEARVVVDATAEELRMTAGYGQSSSNWSAFRPGGRELATMFVLVTATKARLPIPKRAFSEADLAAFRQLLRQKHLVR
jgi:hypothetical protein